MFTNLIDRRDRPTLFDMFDSQNVLLIVKVLSAIMGSHPKHISKTYAIFIFVFILGLVKVISDTVRCCAV